MRTTKLLTYAQFARQGEPYASIALPHTWNALDGQDGGNDYYRGIGTYVIDLPDPTPGKKQYIEIQGANHVATVWCNGRELGTHKGGFSTFRYDLTPAMKESGNKLTVSVSNAKSDIYPQSADFTFFGGMYRDLNFIEVDDAHFDLLKDGTSGVFVTARTNGKTRVDLFPVNAYGATVAVSIKDAEGSEVAAGSADAAAHTVIKMDVKAPHLWNSMEDPYCYTAEASIVKDGDVVDSVTVTFGYPQTKAGQAQAAGMHRATGKHVTDKMSATCQPKSFAQDTAGKLGVSPRTIERTIQTMKGLTQETRDVFHHFPNYELSQTNAAKLSRLEPAKQKTAAILLATDHIRSVDEYDPEQVNMSVGIVTVSIVDAHIGAHSLRNKLLPNEIREQRFPLFSV